MNNIWNSIKLDYYILKSADFRRILIIAVVALLAGFLGKDPTLILGIILTISGFFMSTIFAIVEKNSLNKLYGILPVQRRETVVGRYVFTIIAGIVIAALASMLTFAVAYILKIEISSFTMAAWLCCSFLLFCLLVSVQFPLYFKYDFSKLAALANLPYVLVIIVGAYLVRKDPTLFTRAVKFFIQNPSMIWIAAIGGGLVLLALSMLISIGLYKTREL